MYLSFSNSTAVVISDSCFCMFGNFGPDVIISKGIFSYADVGNYERTEERLYSQKT